MSALRRLREDTGLSLSEVSRRTGIDVAQLHRFESGQMVPTVARLRQLGKVYGLSSWRILRMMEDEEGEDEGESGNRTYNSHKGILTL